MILTLKK